MPTIACPGSQVLSSSRTRTSAGIFTESNRRAAATRAHQAVLADLVAQVNAARCTGPCLKSTGPTVAPAPGATCRRIWWTFWIAVRCTATARGQVEVHCTVEG